MKNKFKKLLAISLTTLSLSCAAFSMNVSAYGGSATFYVNGFSGVGYIDRTSTHLIGSTSSSTTNLFRAVIVEGFRSNAASIRRNVSYQTGNAYLKITTSSSLPFTEGKTHHCLKVTDGSNTSNFMDMRA